MEKKKLSELVFNDYNRERILKYSGTGLNISTASVQMASSQL